MTPALGVSTVKELEGALRGRILLRSSDGYDQSRQVWNGMIDKRPLAIVKVAGVADIQATVKFAQERGLPVAIRGGGHNVAGSAVCDDGLVIDLALMKSIRVDPHARRARAEGGVLWGEYDHQTQAFGLASPGGAVSTTGIAGLTLGGGFGYLSRMYGLACDNLISADVVTAAGEFVIASENLNPELFWGLRGGGGNFGVVTSFEYQLYPVQQVLSGIVAFPFEMSEAVLKRYRDVALEAPDHRVWFAGILQIPGVGKLVAVVMSNFGSEDEGWRALRPIRELGSTVLDTVATVPYCVMQRQLDANSPKGLRNYWKSAYMSQLSDEVIGLLVAAMENTPADRDQIMIESHGGAISRVAKDATAFEHRYAPFNLGIFAVSTDPMLDQADAAWARKLYQQILPNSTGGSYVNYLSEGDDVHTAYSDARFGRLAGIKARHDPGNLFRFNHNIAPA
ncbi:MAG: FAD-binding oxidoreductase [Bryobacteraceae bacterium]|nr:FAD-binding oxidoreductase [Bryobacteraceae bacterium]